MYRTLKIYRVRDLFTRKFLGHVEAHTWREALDLAILRYGINATVD